MGVSESTHTGYVPAASKPAASTPQRRQLIHSLLAEPYPHLSIGAGKSVACSSPSSTLIATVSNGQLKKLPESLGGGTRASQEATLSAGANSHPLAALTGDVAGRVVGAVGAGNLAGGALGAAGAITGAEDNANMFMAQCWMVKRSEQAVASTLTNPTLDKFISAVAEKVGSTGRANATRRDGLSPAPWDRRGCWCGCWWCWCGEQCSSGEVGQSSANLGRASLPWTKAS